MSKNIKIIILIIFLCSIIVCQNHITIKANADVTAPVIDTTTLKVDKNTALTGDTIKFSVKITDDQTASGDISSPYIDLESPQTKKGEPVNLAYNETEKLYEGTYTVTDSSESGLWKIDYICASDQSKNKTQLYNLNSYGLSPSTDMSTANFTVTGTHADVTAPVIDTTTLKVDKNTALTGDTIKFSVKITDDQTASGDISSPYIDLESPQTKKGEPVNLAYNETEKLYEGTYTVTDSSESGLWKIDYICASDQSKNKTQLYNLNSYGLSPSTDMSTANFTVTGTHADVTAPVIDTTTLKVDKNTALTGDTIKFSVKIMDDQTASGDISSPYIDLESPQTKKGEPVNLAYNETEKLYEGIYTVTDSSESGLWKISFICASDRFENKTLIYNSNLYVFNPSADMNTADFRVFSSQEDFDEYKMYSTIPTVPGDKAYYENSNISNQIIDGDLFVGPNALVTLYNTTVNGNIYVLGGLKAQSITAKKIYANAIHLGYVSSYSHGTVSITGTNSIEAMISQNYPVESIPINLQSNLVALDDKLTVKGATFGIADFSINGEIYSLYDNEKFIKELDVTGKDKISFEWKTVFGNTITKEYDIDKIYTTPSGATSHKSQIIAKSDIILLKGRTYDLQKYISVSDKEDGDNNYKSCNIDDSQLNINQAGTYSIKVTVTDQDDLVSIRDIPVSVVEKYNISKGNVALTDTAAQIYNGTEKKPEVIISYAGYILKEGLDYTVAYENNINAGMADVVVTGCGDYAGSLTQNFKIESKELEDSMIETILDQYYTGQSITPVIKIKDSDALLKCDIDYTVSYINNTQIGIAGVTINGIGNYSGEKSIEFNIIPVKVNSVSIKQNGPLIINAGETTKLETQILPDNATDRGLTWSSNNPSIADVVDGIVYAHQPGSATITVTTHDGNYVDTCLVYVPQPVLEVVLNYDNLTLEIGGASTITATVIPENATNKDVSWSSDNESVATVDQNGNVTAKSAGSAIITASADNGKKTETCTVTVNSPDPDAKIKAFVTALYNSTLGRSPEAEGLNYWTNCLKDGSKTGKGTVGEFVSGSEFIGKNYCNEHYVEHLYTAILGRAPDEGGKAYWTGRLNDGMKREQLINEFMMGSNEFSDICSNAGIKLGNPVPVPEHSSIQTWPCSEDGKLDNGIGKFVMRLYTTCLGRDAEKEGANYWIVQLNNGYIGGTAVAEKFFFGSEFIGFNLNNGEYVRRLYTTILDRTPEQDMAGYNYWVGRLEGGTDRLSLLREFVSGEEWAGICSKFGIKK